MIRWIGLFLAWLCIPAVAHADWHRAESEQFVVYADRSADDIRDFTAKLERFDGVLRLFTNTDAPPSPTKFCVFMVSNTDQVRRYLGTGSGVVGYYIPDIRGPFTVVQRRDTGSGFNRMTAENVLFHEYTHHFMLQYFPASYPAWYVEGFAEYFATVRFRDDGQIEVGAPPNYRGRTLGYGDLIPLSQMLSNERANSMMTYAQGWLLTHYAFHNDVARQALTRYLTGMSQGLSGREAYAASFEPLGRGFERDFRQYLRSNRFPAVTIDGAMFEAGEIAVTPISDAEAEIALLYPRREDLMEGTVRRAVRRYPTLPSAHVELARYEFENDNFEAAAATADQALALDATHIGGNLIKGMALIAAARASENPGDPRWSEGRELVIRANNADPDNAQALMAYATSFPDGERNPETAFAALEQAFYLVPQNPALRLAVGRAYLSTGRYQDALNAVLPVVQFPHDSEGRQAGAEIAERARRALTDAEPGGADSE